MSAQISLSENTRTYILPAQRRSAAIRRCSDPAELAAIRFVQRLGIRPNLTGYKLLIRSITTALNNPSLLSSLTHSLYPAVAEYHGCDVRAVERNIRRAIDSAFEYDPERIRDIFYYKVDKPYISEVISLAVESIRYDNACEGYMPV